MDIAKAGRRGRPRLTLAPNLESLEGRQLLAASAGQLRLQEISTNNYVELLITGTPQNDVVTIDDNGTGTAGNIRVTLADGTSYTSKQAISQVAFQGRRGNDQVTYNLNGDLVASRTVLIDLGAGDDQFTGNVKGAIDTSATFALEAFGDPGNDNMVINESGAVQAGTFFPYLEGNAGNDTLGYNAIGNISAGATVGPGMSGGVGNDTITANYAGVVNGTYLYNLTMDGGAGNDTLSNNAYVLAGSNGQLGANSSTKAVVQGGAGNDQIRDSVIVDPTATAVQVNMSVIGGAGSDTIHRTSNVTSDSSNENDAILT